jgi:hypothetical protein
MPRNLLAQYHARPKEERPETPPKKIKPPKPQERFRRQ